MAVTGAAALLRDVRQLVTEERGAVGGVGLVLASGEVDIAPDRDRRVRRWLSAIGVGLRAGVQACGADIAEPGARGGIDRRTRWARWNLVRRREVEAERIIERAPAPSRIAADRSSASAVGLGRRQGWRVARCGRSPARKTLRQGPLAWRDAGGAADAFVAVDGASGWS
jgi:hypothetical protein